MDNDFNRRLYLALQQSGAIENLPDYEGFISVISDEEKRGRLYSDLDSLGFWGDGIDEGTYQKKTQSTDDELSGLAELKNAASSLIKYFIHDGFMGSINESQYRPTNEQDRESKYFSFPGVLKKVVEDISNIDKPTSFNNWEKIREKNLRAQGHEYTASLAKDNSFEEIYGQIKELPRRFSNSSIDDFELGSYQLHAGEDDRGKYISIYDKYDWDFINGIKEAIGLSPNEGFEIYDRIYEDDYNKFIQETNSTSTDLAGEAASSIPLPSNGEQN